MWAAASLKSTGLVDNPGYESGATANDSCALGGLISFLLTVLNIVCVFLAAYVMFEIKQVRGANKFWKEDVANARKCNKALRHDSAVASIYQKGFQHAVEQKDKLSRREYQTPLERIRMNWAMASSVQEEEEKKGE